MLGYVRVCYIMSGYVEHVIVTLLYPTYPTFPTQPNQSVCSIQTVQVCFYFQNPILKMASGNLLDRLVWQFRHLWRDCNKARLSIESDHDGNAYASLHVDLGQQRGGRPQRHSPPTTTRPPKSCHTQTQPINLSKEQDHDTQAGRTILW